MRSFFERHVDRYIQERYTADVHYSSSLQLLCIGILQAETRRFECQQNRQCYDHSVYVSSNTPLLLLLLYVGVFETRALITAILLLLLSMINCGVCR